jgi:LEA14-like dessication related protein
MPKSFRQYHICFNFTISTCTKLFWHIKSQERSLCRYYCSIAVDHRLSKWTDVHISVQPDWIQFNSIYSIPSNPLQVKETCWIQN